MKWNWGKGIVIGMLAFMSFIMYFVVTMSINKKYSHDLVTEKYYAKEMAYQTEIDAETNTYNLKGKIEGRRTDKGWLLTFPNDLEFSKIEGKVFLYRPSNQQLDFDLPVVFSGTNLLIPDKQMVDGRWNITIEWTYNDKEYLYKKSIVY